MTGIYTAERIRISARARGLVRTAIRRGDLHRGLCETCGSSDVEAHHDDYSKPLEVRWLCYRHHVMLHRYGSIPGYVRAAV